MDLSPKLLTDVQFREQWRGYNPDEVDEFLERVAAGVEELQHRLTETLERASAAERRLLERSDEDEIRRTLVLAQRTAVASIEEARAEADRLVSETESRCRQLVAEAEAQAAQLEADVATRRRLELGDLSTERAKLQADVDNLRQFLDVERERVASMLRGQIEWLESGYHLAPEPTVSDVAAPPAAPVAPVETTVPEPVEAAPVLDAEPEPVAAATDEPELVEDVDAVVAVAPAPLAEPDDDDDDDDAGSAVDELRLAREELADALRRAGVDPADDLADVETDAADGDDADDRQLDGGPAIEEPLQLEPQRPRPALFDDAGEATAAYDALAELSDLAGEERGDHEPGPAVQWRDEEAASEDDEDDPFLAELRRAVIDTEPLGPRDDDEPRHAPVEVDDDDRATGFFRRGRRRP